MSYRLITDPPDPNCEKCSGTGVRGSCRERGCPPNKGHAHTMWFCECVNERSEPIGESDGDRGEMMDLDERGQPHPIDLVFELREALGMFAGAMPIPPKEAWEQALARARELRAAAAAYIEGRELSWCEMHDDQQYGDKPHYCGVNWDGEAAAPCRMVRVRVVPYNEER